jgi:hypothetical protein
MMPEQKLNKRSFQVLKVYRPWANPFPQRTSSAKKINQILVKREEYFLYYIVRQLGRRNDIGVMEILEDP